MASNAMKTHTPVQIAYPVTTRRKAQGRIVPFVLPFDVSTTKQALASLSLSLSLSVSISICTPSEALAASEGTVQVFENSCAGCHAGGGNIVKRDATLALSDLQKYGLDGPDQLYDIIYSGRGSMPGFGEGCAPKGACTFAKRLTDDQVRDLAGYILEQPW